MTYAVKIDGTWIEKTPRQFRADRNASIPDANLKAEGLYEVTVDPKPDVNLGQTIEQGPIVDREELPFRTWTVRDKTPEEIEAETQAKRQGMAVPRDDFAAAVMVSGIITPQEAQDWASGNALPEVVKTALIAGITDPTQLAIAKIKALSSANIGRTNPLIDMLAATFKMTPDQVDTLFETAKQIGDQP